MIKRFKDLLVLSKHISNATIQLTWYKVVEGIMNMVTDVQKHGKPMLTKIAAIDMSKEKIIGDFDMVSVWAGVGESNPIEIIRQLKAQNLKMKQLLEQCKTKINIASNKDLYVDISIVIDTFD